MITTGRGRIRSVTDHDVDWLTDGWEFGAAEPGDLKGPADLTRASLAWTRTTVPSTVAASLQCAGAWSIDGTPRRFDAIDWWYRTTFTAAPLQNGEQLWLCFDGLATIADVWLNGELLLSVEGMFTTHERRIDSTAGAENHLVICFRSLDSALAQRRPRPGWRAPMVEHQQLRWFRTTLLGRTPGWSPPAAAVGPWRGVRLERRRGVQVHDVRLNVHSGGAVDVSCQVESLDANYLTSVEFVLERDGREFRAALAPTGKAGTLAGRLTVPAVARWWPNTHGPSPLYDACLDVRHAQGLTQVNLGHVGFRSISLVTRGDDFSIVVNGVPVFCRGACWTPLDVVSLVASEAQLDRAFSQVVDAGMNMLRVGGTMVYESDGFLDRCDARGVMLWQDFMFANMDYPGEDRHFADHVMTEARQQLLRLQGRPSLAMLCGNSEGEQQAAMWGATRERWSPTLFHEGLARLSSELCPRVPYTPSSAYKGAFPHQVNAGPSSYYGVGAYLRPLEDARRAEVRFASECLAFANIPAASASATSPLTGVKVHQPAWKARAPRDLGAGWDFDDVRDHYLAHLFRVDPAHVRYADHERYLALGRVVTGEVMAATFAEWRRGRSVTRGGLVWFLRDLWGGAGWGVVDAHGKPKPAWYYLRRACAPVAVSLSDEGSNGMQVHVVNDGSTPLVGLLELTLYKREVRVAQGAKNLAVAPHAAAELNAVSLFEGFFDLSYAYRFGPPSHDVIVATLRDSTERILARAFHFVAGLPNTQEPDLGLTAYGRALPDGCYELTVQSRRLAQSIRIDAGAYEPEDNYFHLAPGEARAVRLTPDAAAPPGVTLRGTVQPLNAESPTPIALEA